jgi:tRNA(adenine34) deaminase
MVAVPQSSARISGFMDAALEQARLAGQRGEVPVGAVIVLDGRIIAAEGNRTRERHDVTAHAEIAAIRRAAAHLASERLVGADLYVTLEPCAMCAAAISFARIRRLYFGATDVKGGAVISGGRFFEQTSCHHAPEVYSGMAEADCAALLVAFFDRLR